MIQRQEYSDNQYDDMCAYCGSIADTRDHVPSKILLDEPYEDNLPVVPCCQKCNNYFSKYEEYFACAIECCKYMTIEPEKLHRKKVINALNHNSELRHKLNKSIIAQENLFGEKMRFFNFDTDKIYTVITKLAKGHARFEHSTPFLEQPKSIFFNIRSNLSGAELNSFYTNIQLSNISPEVGSRSLNYISSLDASLISKWHVIQSDHYQYVVYYDDVNNNTVVKIELAKLFCIQVIL